MPPRAKYPVGIISPFEPRFAARDILTLGLRMWVLLVGSTVRLVVDDRVVLAFGDEDERGHADGTIANARFDTPHKICADENGNLYVLDRESCNYPYIERIRRIINWERVETVTASLPYAVIRWPCGIAYHQGRLLIASCHDKIVLSVNATTGTMEVLAGERPGGAAILQGIAPIDGDVAVARFRGPRDIRSNRNGNVFVADYNIIRRIDTDTNLVSTLIVEECLGPSIYGVGIIKSFVVDAKNAVVVLVDIESSYKLIRLDPTDTRDVYKASMVRLRAIIPTPPKTPSSIYMCSGMDIDRDGSLLSVGSLRKLSIRVAGEATALAPLGAVMTSSWANIKRMAAIIPELRKFLRHFFLCVGRLSRRGAVLPIMPPEIWRLVLLILGVGNMQA